jgi:hypothetical protein
MASRTAISPISRCRTPLTANPARAASSSVRELVMSSAAPAASFSSLLMIDPSTDSVVLPDRSSARFHASDVIVPRETRREQHQN